MKEPNIFDAGSERGDIAQVAAVALTDANGIDRERGASARHDATSFAEMASAAACTLSKIPSGRPSQSRASKPSLPRGMMKPRQRLPL
jgi:hypothetical protein